MNQETPKPNFDFIVNQPGPELNKPKRSKKPLIIIGSAVVILFSLVAFAAIFGKKVTNVTPASNVSTGATYRQTAQTFITDMQAGATKLDKNTVKLIGGSLYVGDDANYFLLQRLASTIDFKSCNLASSSATTTGYDFIYSCKTTSAGKPAIVKLSTKTINKKVLITAHKVSFNA